MRMLLYVWSWVPNPNISGYRYLDDADCELFWGISLGHMKEQVRNDQSKVLKQIQNKLKEEDYSIHGHKVLN